MAHPKAYRLAVLSMIFFASTGICLAANPPTITLQGTIRDFLSSPSQTYPAAYGTINYNPDFENPIALDPGIVKNVLGVDGKPVYASSTTTASTHGANYFNQWFRDTPGFNISQPLSITLNDTGGGIYQYSNNNFFPIDDSLLGNFGSSGHNFSLTYELEAQFTYSGPASFSFTGDDDLWVFINKNLVIDLGGVHTAGTSSVDISPLGLTVGDTYELNVFWAERHTNGSSFAMTTSLALSSAPPAVVPEPSTLSSAMGATLIGVAAISIRRAVCRRKR